MDEKILQEEVTEASELNAPVENPQIMEVEEEKDEMGVEEEKDEMVYPKDDEDKEDMEYPKEDEEKMEEPMDEEEDEEEKEEEMVKDKDKEDYSGTVESEGDSANYIEDDKLDEEESQTTQSVKIEAKEESSSATLSHSERAELEAFRRERKEGLISSFEDDLSNEFIEKLKTEIDNYSIDELEVLLSKEYTRVNRATKTTKPNAFIYKPDAKSTTKSEADIVKELVQKYK